MAPNSLSPASAVIGYSTLYGSHRMTVPTSQWFPTSITGTIGSYVDHDGDPIDAEEMWTDFVTLLLPFVKPSTSFDSVTIYTQATPTSDNIPRASTSLAMVGVNASTGLFEAQSITFNFKTSDNGDMKIVLLDVPLGASGFNAVHPADFNAETLALEVFLTGRDTAILGRDDSIARELRKLTYDLNKKLQRAYKMGA